MNRLLQFDRVILGLEIFQRFRAFTSNQPSNREAACDGDVSPRKKKKDQGEAI